MKHSWIYMCKVSYRGRAWSATLSMPVNHLKKSIFIIAPCFIDLLFIFASFIVHLTYNNRMQKGFFLCVQQSVPWYVKTSQKFVENKNLFLFLFWWHAIALFIAYHRSWGYRASDKLTANPTFKAFQGLGPSHNIWIQYITWRAFCAQWCVTPLQLTIPSSERTNLRKLSLTNKNAVDRLHCPPFFCLRSLFSTFSFLISFLFFCASCFFLLRRKKEDEKKEGREKRKRKQKIKSMRLSAGKQESAEKKMLIISFLRMAQVPKRRSSIRKNAGYRKYLCIEIIISKKSFFYFLIFVNMRLIKRGTRSKRGFKLEICTTLAKDLLRLKIRVRYFEAGQKRAF